MSDFQSQPKFRPLAQRQPDIICNRLGDGTVYLKQKHNTGPRPKSIPHALLERAEKHPHRAWLKQRDRVSDLWKTVSYKEGADGMLALGQSFMEIGAGPNSPVMILSGNSIDSALVIMGAMAIGAPVAPISAPYSLMSTDFDKLKHCFNSIRPKIIFVEALDTFRPALEALGDHGCTVISSQEDRRGVLSLSNLLSTNPSELVLNAIESLSDETVAKYLFTSGSTGMPKPVPTTQGAMCSMIGGVEGLRDDSRDPEFDPDRGENFLDWLPWNHISGSNVNFNGVLWNGGTFWIDNGKPTPALFKETIRNIRDAKPSTFGTAPIALAMLADAMEEDDELLAAFFENMRTIAYGGATLSDDLYDRLQALAIKATGRKIPIITMYGATETQGVTVVHWEVDRVGLIGLPIPGTTLKLVPNGSKMEVRVKGPTLMKGYHNMPEKNAEVFDEEGFYCLGDAAKFVDESDPNKGIIFDGRVGEDFKLSSGTWVSVGVLRPDIVAACSPLVFDAVICGQDKDYIGAMFWPSPAVFEQYVKSSSGDVPTAFAKLTNDIKAKVGAFNTSEGGSSRRIKRFLILTDPPSIDRGEITDKGYVNQRQTQDCRSDLVASLFADAPPAFVITV